MAHIEEASRTLKDAAKDISDYEEKVRKAWRNDPKETPEPDMYYREPDPGIKAADEKASETDKLVNKPSYYTQFKIEPITFIMLNDLPFWLGNVVKYGLRAGHKEYPGKSQVESEIIDLEKARRYCEMRINQLKGYGIL